MLWRTEETTTADEARYFSGSACRMIACIEAAWLTRVEGATLHRYSLPPEPFAALEDAGMWVSRRPVRPLSVTRLTDLPKMLAEKGVELRSLETLRPLRDVWQSSLHASGIRLRNAQG